MLPVGPELDRIYRLKFIGLGVHEQLMTGQGGSYSQAYIGLEVQRQRYLNFQLKLENFVHSGIFKTIADLCGFYRIKNSVLGYGKTSSYSWGKPDIENLPKVFSGLRDYKDNLEFQNFIQKKASEKTSQVREYVYPKLDWGAMSAASDENLKNYIKWLADKRPHLVDDALLARIARLDRDTQEKAYIEDMKRSRDRYQILAKEGLLPFAQKSGPAAGGDMGSFDLGGLGGAPEGGAEMGGVGMGGGEEPQMPVGVGGPPEASEGQVAPQSVASALKGIEGGVVGELMGDDLFYSSENRGLLNLKKTEMVALLKEVNK